MTTLAPGIDEVRARTFPFPRRHFLSALDLNVVEAGALLDLADTFVDLNRQTTKKLDLLKGRTLVNMFFENSTRTQASFELAGKRLDAGDGQHEHPTQALLDALSMRRAFGSLAGLTVAICGDVMHSRVARSNVNLLGVLGAEVRLVGPPTLMPAGADRWGATVFHDLEKGIAGADVVMMLRLQMERMQGALVPSTREYFRYWGLDREKLKAAADGVKVMHPGPMNRGVEIDSDVADDPAISLIQDQVEMGVAARMAVLASLSARLDNDR
jgi:aspartate carbamoyltransferase catalytic subunit